MKRHEAFPFDLDALDDIRTLGSQASFEKVLESFRYEAVFCVGALTGALSSRDEAAVQGVARILRLLGACFGEARLEELCQLLEAFCAKSAFDHVEWIAGEIATEVERSVGALALVLAITAEPPDVRLVA